MQLIKEGRIIGKRLGRPGAATRQNPWGLTAREAAVVRLICQGMYTATIAERMTISERTLQAHLSNIFTKVRVYDRVELIVKILHHPLAREIFFPELQISESRKTE